jgi:hypothetical protein
MSLQHLFNGAAATVRKLSWPTELARAVEESTTLNLSPTTASSIIGALHAPRAIDAAEVTAVIAATHVIPGQSALIQLRSTNATGDVAVLLRVVNSVAVLHTPRHVAGTPPPYCIPVAIIAAPPDASWHGVQLSYQVPEWVPFGSHIEIAYVSIARQIVDLGSGAAHQVSLKIAVGGDEAPASVVATMGSRAGAADVAEWGCTALSKLGVRPEDKQRALDAGAYAAIVSAMRTHDSDAAVAHWGCRALALLTANFVAGKQAATDVAAPFAVMKALQTHENVPDVALYGCWALGVLTGVVAGAQMAADLGAPVAIVSAMRTHGLDLPDVLFKGIIALNNIASQSPDRGAAATVAAGAPAAIVKAMRLHLQHGDVIEKGCNALRQFAGFRAGKHAVFNAGGIAALTTALTALALNAKVAYAGCGALDALFAERWNSTPAERAMLDAAHVHVPVAAAAAAALSAHSDVAQVVKSACAVLAFVTVSEAGRLSAIAGGAPAALVAAIRAPDATEAVILPALSVLTSLSAIPPGSLASVVEAGVPAVLAWAFQHEAYTAQACAAITSVAALPAGLRALVDGGMLAAAVGVIRTPATPAPRASAVYAMLTQVASVSGGLQAFIDCGVLAAAIAAVRAPTAAMSLAVALLSTIASQPEGLQSLVDSGTLADIVALLRAGLATAESVRPVLALLNNACKLPTGLRAVSAAGGVMIAAVVDTMRAHPADAVVASSGCQLIAVVAKDSSECRQAAITAGGITAVTAAMAAHAVARPSGLEALKCL